MRANSIGEFIQLLRKEKGLTQKELAEIIGMSDKTISKWENGNSLPDTSMLIPICQAFDITVNELLSCERISPENYSAKAEETIMSLIKENENSKKGNKLTGIIGMILLVMSVIFLLVNTPYGYEGLAVYPFSFIDIPGLIMIILASAGIVLIAGMRGKKNMLELLSKVIIPVGAVISLASIIEMLTILESPSMLGPYIHIILSSLLYTFIIKIVVEIVIARK